MKITYLLATRIIKSEGKFTNLDSILTSKVDQPSFYFGDNLILEDGGYIVLDFGKEISGGIRIVNLGSGSQKDNNIVRIRFGESVSEVMFNVGEHNSTNNHSPRDFEYLIPDFSKVEVGDTGFRFVRIDFKKGINQRIYSINAISKEIDNEVTASFLSSDEELNKIFEVGARTAKLCVLDYIVDGIKRDRLVWAGDLLVELKSLNYLYGNISQVEKTFLFLEQTNDLNGYIQYMPTYNLWYLACINEYYKLNGFNNFVKERRDRIEAILKLANNAVKENGSVSYEGVEYVSLPYFIDWRTSDESDAQSANSCFYLYVLNTCKELINQLGLSEISNEAITKLNKFSPKTFDISQFDCFSLLTNKGNKEEIVKTMLESRESQLCPFSCYFVLNSLFNENKLESLKIFKNYHSAMINLGATTFFEEFEFSWKDSVKVDEMPIDKFNFLTDSGKGCYEGLRKSLCHGWASSPVSYIIENIVGFKGVEENTVYLKPYTDCLENFESSFNCSLGLIRVSYKNNKLNVEAPEGVTYKLI